ncbi:MAG: methionine synthase [Lentisphaeria bacterium]|nr:methionine synthase [Lentisphaeria bacterium]
MRHKNMDILLDALSKRILILDGATGTELQKQGLTEADFRGTLFPDSAIPLKGNNDVLCLTCPDAVRKVHHSYLDAGADIIETNTFSANRISQAEYGLEDHVYAIAKAGAAIARECADRYTAKNPGKPRFVAGSIGPTSRTASMSPDVNNPAFRNVTFAELAATYKDAALGMIDGGADIFLLETIFDTLNCKAGIYGIREALEERGLQMPVMISATLSDASGRLLAGQNVEAFMISVAHTTDLLSVGFNCALGAAEMAPHIEELASICPVRISAHPNAGLPDEMGRYTQTPEEMAAVLQGLAKRGLLNIAGGCCGTNPNHIRAIAQALDGIAPRIPAPIPKHFRLAGLDPLVVTKETNFINIGERTNVAGSKKFLNLIRDNNFAEAMRIARQQIENGARIIDVNMDDSLLDSKNVMCQFLLTAAAEPEIARTPVMIDSSRWEVIEAALQCVQGKCVVNSISLKEGEGPFLEKARKIRRYGAAALVMAFDENGQADTLDRRIAVCRRSYELLTEKADFPPEDIIFDPNVFAVATGMKEHDNYARDFIDAVGILKKEMPLCGVSGGISNVSFSFRGNNTVREALHSVFLYHAIRNGMDFGIVNPAQLAIYEELPEDLRKSAEAVILNTHPGAADELLKVAEKYRKTPGETANVSPAWREEPLEKRIEHAMLHGDDSFIEADVEEALGVYPGPVAIIEGPLMNAMKRVGELFGAGQMFLPQVVKSARVMKAAVAKLMPLIEAAGRESGAGSSNGTILLATVKGDVHDIGKNIAGVVLQCNNYKIIDLGVMVPKETILEAAEREHADLIGLSGLITPSLEEMVSIAGEMERRGMKIPLLLGGATTSQAHTALKVAPAYPSGPVIQVHDASQGVLAVNSILNPKTRDAYWQEVRTQYEKIRVEADLKASRVETLPLAEARANALKTDWKSWKIGAPGKFRNVTDFQELDLNEVFCRIDWQTYHWIWQDKPESSSTLRSDAEALLQAMRLSGAVTVSASLGFFPAYAENDSIVLPGEKAVFPMLRQQFRKYPGQFNLALSDYFPPEPETPAWCGFFAVGCRVKDDFMRAHSSDDYSTLLVKTLEDRLAEAAAGLLQEYVRQDWQGADRISIIRPAPGYPAVPDHALKTDIFRILDVERKYGFRLTESYMMIPASSVCGFMIVHPQAQYFAIGRIGADQLTDYAARRGGEVSEVERFIAWREKEMEK